MSTGDSTVNERGGLFSPEAFEQISGQLSMADRTWDDEPIVGRPMKDYYVRSNIGMARYVVSFHDGVKTHDDGSRFYDIRIASNKRDLHAIIAELQRTGYAAR